MSDERYALRLYVAGATETSARAIANLRKLCEAYLQGNVDVEVIDISQDSRMLVADSIVAAPTLVKSLPLPVKHLVGDLANEQAVLVALDLPRPEATHW